MHRRSLRARSQTSSHVYLRNCGRRYFGTSISVTFDQGADERIVKKFLLTKREKLVQEKQIQNVPFALGVRQLRLTNCIALPSKAIIDVTRRCYNLRELYWIAEPCELFYHLSRLQQCTEEGGVDAV
ncbi:hypothetical protein MTO96_043760 [Rhipicephalus appendiculatus]